MTGLAGDPLTDETTATYEAIDMLLASWVNDEEHRRAYHELVDRLVELDRETRRRMEQQHVVWASRHLAGGGSGE